MHGWAPSWRGLYLLEGGVGGRLHMLSQNFSLPPFPWDHAHLCGKTYFYTFYTLLDGAPCLPGSSDSFPVFLNFLPEFPILANPPHKTG